MKERREGKKREEKKSELNLGPLALKVAGAILKWPGENTDGFIVKHILVLVQTGIKPKQL